MRSSNGHRTTYGVYTKFRQSRLALRRGIVDVADAIEFARQMRALRFHDPDDVVIVQEPSDVIVGDAPCVPATEVLGPAPPQVAPAPIKVPSRLDVDGHVANLLRFYDGMQRAKQSCRRAASAQARFEDVFSATQEKLGGCDLSEAIRRVRERTLATHRENVKVSMEHERTIALLEAGLRRGFRRRA
jgi:hypothetical protein